MRPEQVDRLPGVVLQSSEEIDVANLILNNLARTGQKSADVLRRTTNLRRTISDARNNGRQGIVIEHPDSRMLIAVLREYADNLDGDRSDKAAEMVKAYDAALSADG